MLLAWSFCSSLQLLPFRLRGGSEAELPIMAALHTIQKLDPSRGQVSRIIRERSHLLNWLYFATGITIFWLWRKGEIQQPASCAFSRQGSSSVELCQIRSHLLGFFGPALFQLCEFRSLRWLVLSKHGDPRILWLIV